HDQPPRDDHERNHHDRRQGAAQGGPRARRAALRRGHGLPVVQPLRPPDRARERHPRPHQGARHEEGRRRARGARAARAGRRRRAGGQAARAALGRSAAARRDRPRARHEAQGHALRRADERARPGDDQRGPRRHGGARAGGHDDDRRHPRDGLRAQGRRPGHLHGRRPHRRRGRARRVLHPSPERSREGLPVQAHHPLTARPPRAHKARGNTQNTEEEAMRHTRMRAGVRAGAAAVLALGHCNSGSPSSPGGSGDGDATGDGVPWTVATDVTLDGSPTFDAMSQRGKVIVGVKEDQPNLGYLDATTNERTGFDVDIARWIAASLGFDEADIEYKAIASANREQSIVNGDIDYYVGTYSITDKRKEQIDFAGPYFITGQGILVRADDDAISSEADLNADTTVCSATGSTPIQNIRENYPEVPTVEFDLYSACVE